MIWYIPALLLAAAGLWYLFVAARETARALVDGPDDGVDPHAPEDLAADVDTLVRDRVTRGDGWEIIEGGKG